jgi:hypothetical protein
MIGHRHVLALFAWVIACFGVAFPACAVEYRILGPQSSYVYLVPPEGPGVAGCLPDNFHCAFGINGSFEFNLASGAGRFLNPDISLTGNEGTIYGPLTAAAAVESALTNIISPLPLESAVGGSLLFRQPIPPPPAIRFNSIEVLITGNQLSLTGAYDNTGVDGNGHMFQVRAVAVPEPTSVLLASAVIAAGFSMVRTRRPVFN